VHVHTCATCDFCRQLEWFIVRSLCCHVSIAVQYPCCGYGTKLGTGMGNPYSPSLDHIGQSTPKYGYLLTLVVRIWFMCSLELIEVKRKRHIHRCLSSCRLCVEEGPDLVCRGCSTMSCHVNFNRLSPGQAAYRRLMPHA
jgi:hypothetical protein